jgi:ribonuclease BN (tRNA processing enzyme)
MKIHFIGVGSAFTTTDYFQSNMLITSRSGKKLLLDCGSDARFALAEHSSRHHGLTSLNIDAVYISHLHADHIGGMEWLAFTTYFNPDIPRPQLFAENTLLHEMWNDCLQGGLRSIGAKLMHLTDYFACHALSADGEFEWEGIHFKLFRMPHILNGFSNHYSYALRITETNTQRAIFISTDTIFCPDILAAVAPQVDVIFHDCETSPFPTGVHAHYQELMTLPAEIKNRMWLYHYQPHPPFHARDDGFLGFVYKGQGFEF